VAVIVGLRNPGDTYTGTRHNVGAEVVEALAERWSVDLGSGPRGIAARVATARVGGQPVRLVLPNAFMNESGPPVQAVSAYFGADADDLLVVHDDIDLEFARLRVAHDRGPGGHNGIRSIAQSLGTEAFWRLKVGVGRPPGRMDPAAFVLARFTPEERDEVDLLVADAADVVERWLDDPERARELAAHRQPG
jgi:PTH1 family peptidyl-tRNA hydrolase